MFDIGWLELLIIGIVALIVVGPKDLPGMFRTVGQFMGKARAMAREFQRTMEAAADETGLKEATKGLQTMTDPLSSAKSSFKDLASSVTAAEGSKDAEEAQDAGNAAAKAKAAEVRATREATERAATEAATKAAETAAADKT